MNSCKKKSNGGFLSHSNPYSGFNFSEIKLDSLQLNSFFLQYNIEDSVSEYTKKFYTRRAYQLAWFDTNGITEASHIFYDQLSAYAQTFNDHSLNVQIIDSLINIGQLNHEKLEKKDIHIIELFLTTHYFRFAEKAYGGIKKDLFELDWYIPRNKKDFLFTLNSLVSNAGNPNVKEPVNLNYKLLKEQLAFYKNLEKTASFSLLNIDLKKITLKDTSACIKQVKNFLFIYKDLNKKDTSAVFNKDLETALTHFQKRIGLEANGNLNLQTLRQINTPIEDRIKQIMVNLERLRWLPEEIESDYLLVNIPEFKLHVYEKGKHVYEANVVVGKVSTKTRVFKGELATVILNPYWGIPKSIADNEILPKLKKSSSYLSKNNMEVFENGLQINPNTVNWSKYPRSGPYNFRQKPGKNNSLGKIKFLFPNPYNIYLHDTPSKSDFKKSQRAFSHGCIRVQNPKTLAEYILRNNSKWNIENINNVLETNREQAIKIEPKVPVFVVYLSAWVDHTGQLNFRDDIYGFDKKLSKEIFEKPKN
jgi:murein L,D-transpeptidase YcbB/YkuD